MTIQRSGPTPTFDEYICKYLLIPHSGQPSPQVNQLIGPGGQQQWIEIPRFQRGISWDVENVKELFQSTSILLGTAILSQFQRNKGEFPNLPANQNTYLLLIDGLQRFAVGTALLSILHDIVLAPQPNRPGDAVHFIALTARVTPFSAYYLHNDKELKNHPRQAIKDQYLSLRRSLEDFITQEFGKGNGLELANLLVPTFITRQIAIDIYFNFQRIEVLNTFIGINTVRVDLGPVDLLRAHILEQATAASWSEQDVEEIENEFTDTFTSDQKPKQHFLPFVNAALKVIDSKSGARLFPSWNIGLQKVEVDNFLDFVDQYENAFGVNAYLAEILNSGKLPISIILAYYYIDYIHGSKKQPSFFNGGVVENKELNEFLIACYRLILEGSIGRTATYLEKIMAGQLKTSLSKLADSISIDYLGIDITSSVDAQWLETALNKIDNKKAPRIFNAMLLPQKNNLGQNFTPLIFGKKTLDFHIDHLIPFTLLHPQMPGGIEGDTIRNFAPLPTNQNRAAKARNCSTKLSANDIYDTYLASTTHTIHPYCQWLVRTHVSTYQVKDLDDQSKLERNSQPDIGTARIRHIIKELLSRI